MSYAKRCLLLLALAVPALASFSSWASESVRLDRVPVDVKPNDPV